MDSSNTWIQIDLKYFKFHLDVPMMHRMDKVQNSGIKRVCTKINSAEFWLSTFLFIFLMLGRIVAQEHLQYLFALY